MSETITALTIKNAPKGILRVEQGLRYKSNGNGTGAWQGRYTINGKDKAITLGKFPAMTLKAAREAIAIQKVKVMEGHDPKAERIERAKASDEKTTSVKQLIELAYDDIAAGWKNGGHRNGFMPKMKEHVYPKIGREPIGSVTPKMLADLVRPMWHTQHPTATKILIHLSSVFGWGEASGYDVDSFAPKRARKILGKTRYRAKNVASMPHKDIPAFYKSLGNGPQDLGLKFYLLTVCRTANAAKARWDQIEGDLWHLSPEDMKREADHYVPLAPQALAVLEDAAKFYDTREGYVFKSKTSYKTGHVAMNGWTQQMRRLGIEATAHGIRAGFKMWALTNDVAPNELIEECLHHKARGAVEQAYIRGHLAELRRPIMQEWANFVTGEAVEIADKPRLSVVG